MIAKNTMEKPVLLTEKTLISRQLAASIMLVVNVFVLLIVLFFAVIFHFDFRANRALEFETNPALYVYLRDYGGYFLVGIPLLGVLTGIGLSLYRAVSIGTLCLYYLVYSLVVLCFTLLSTLTLLLAHGNNVYNMFMHVCP